MENQGIIQTETKRKHGFLKDGALLFALSPQHSGKSGITKDDDILKKLKEVGHVSN